MTDEPPVAPGRRSARAILLDDHGRLVLIRRTRPGQAPFWTTPGGGVERNDASLEAALRRELAEELGAEVANVSQVFVATSPVPDGAGIEHIFAARLTRLDETARHGPELDEPSRGEYDIERIELLGDELASIDLRPATLKEFVLANRDQLVRSVGLGHLMFGSELVVRPRSLPFPIPVLIVTLMVAAALAVTIGFANVVGGVLAAVVLGLVPILIWGHLRYRRVLVTTDEIAVLGFVLRRRRPRERAAHVFRATFPGRGLATYENLFVLDGAGKLVIRVYGNDYNPVDLTRLVEFLRLPSSSPDPPLVTPNQLDAMHPGLVWWWEAHWLRAALYLAVGVLAAASVATVILA